jgi:hypothetical protein
MMKKIIDLEIIDNLEESGVSKISLVDVPAIEKYWMAFKEEQFVEPNAGEREDDFIPRCIAYNVEEGKDPDQAAAICYSTWERHSKVEFAKVSFDYDDTLSTDRGEELARREMRRGNDVYIITARGMAGGEIKSVAERLGIPLSNIFATGSNTAKIKKVRDLGITKHYDNNADVVSNLGMIGEKFSYDTTALPEYVDEIPKKKKEFAGEMDVLGYQTKYFYICPGAQATFEDILSYDLDEDTVGMVRAAAVIADKVFEIEAKVIEDNLATEQQLKEAVVLVEDFGDIIEEIDEDLGTTHDISYMLGHIEVIQGYLQKPEEFSSDLKVDYSAILHLAKNLGFKAEDFESNGMQVDKETGDKTLDLKFAKGYTVYRYEGSIGGDSRDFCQ